MENLIGKWFIQKMELWNEDYINMEIRGFIEIEDNDSGKMQFGAVTLFLDYRKNKSDEIDFSFEGSDDGMPVCGRGWGSIKSNTMQGKIFFHKGDESAFTAKK